MQIDRILYPIFTLGYGSRIVIWTIGCERRCRGCSNPELQAFDNSKDVSINTILDIILFYKDKIDGVTITGGEPFLQKDSLSILVKELKSNGIEDILVYTGNTLNELKDMKDRKIDETLKNIDVLVDGQYIEELNDNKGIRGSSNQKVHIFNPKLLDKYRTLEGERKVQNIYYKNNSINVGIPLKNSLIRESNLNNRGLIKKGSDNI